MSQPLLLKAYGNLYPASQELAQRFIAICQQGLPAGKDVVSLDGDMLRISFEGIYLPLEELAALWREQEGTERSGKLDILDLEAWHLTRYLLKDGHLQTGSAPLNNVLDYSGH